MPKIALAHDHLFQIGGGEKVLKEISRLYPDAPIYTLINNRKITKRLFPKEKIVSSSLQKIPGSSRFFRFFLFFMPKLWENTDLSSYDIVISSASGFVKGVKTGKATHICYCYTPIRYLWGKGHYEENLGNSFEGKLFKTFLPRMFSRLRKWDYEKAQQVDNFIATSEHIAKKIKKHYKRDAIVIYPPVPTDEFSVSNEIDDYYLIVSRLRPYKRVDLAVQAFNNLKLPLKIIGTGTELRRLKRMAHSNIEFLGEVDDKTRNRYLSKCKAFIYPQIEDFGISAVEAMACGRPVIAFAKGGALETVVDGLSGKLFHEQTWESLAHSILRFESDDFEPKAIQEHARKFDTDVFVHKMSSLIKNL